MYHLRRPFTQSVRGLLAMSKDKNEILGGHLRPCIRFHWGGSTGLNTGSVMLWVSTVKRLRC